MPFLAQYRQFFYGMLACLCLLGLLAATFYAGSHVADRAWKIDCFSAKQHRAGSVTYMCIRQDEAH